jgi:dissimilatory sulfite reductase (desulfoviridin) alpha/beta subunit
MIQPGSVRAQVLVGGRMGRHPRWAQELRDVDIAAAAEVVKAFLDCIGRESRPDERVADAVQRISLERLRCQPAYVTGSGVLASEE